MGLQVSGDFADLTIYTDRYGRKVPFLKSPPKEPPSPAQVAQRASFRAAQQSWAALSASQKAALEDACRRTSIPLTGQNLWIHTKMKLDDAAYHTIERQSGINLPSL
jgi:hypothetical protein